MNLPAPLPTLLAATAVAAVVLATAGPAGAETETRTDAAQDVTVSSPQTPGELRTSADIVSLRATHGEGRLVFTFTVADLVSPGFDSFLSATARIVTPSGGDYTAQVSSLFGEDREVYLRRNGEQVVACDGLTGRLVHAKDRYVVSVPRACVKNPRSVRFGGQTYADGDVGTLESATDDARTTSTTPAPIKLGTTALVNN